MKEGHVDGWDDPRMPTIVGVRRRGFTPEGIRLFMDRIGVSKSDSVIEYSQLEDAQREIQNEIAPRRIAVLDPLKLVIDNWPKGHVEECFAPNHPQKADWGKTDPHVERALDRARGFHGGTFEGILPAISRESGAAQVRIRGSVHGIFEGA